VGTAREGELGNGLCFDRLYDPDGGARAKQEHRREKSAM
jgi:hypothetical protein